MSVSDVKCKTVLLSQDIAVENIVNTCLMWTDYLVYEVSPVL